VGLRRQHVRVASAVREREDRTFEDVAAAEEISARYESVLKPTS
jgi:hypothetical protein